MRARGRGPEHAVAPRRRARRYLGRPNLYTTTTTTQRGWRIEAFVSILAQLQSQNHIQEVVVYRISLPNCLTALPQAVSKHIPEQCPKITPL